MGWNSTRSNTPPGNTLKKERYPIRADWIRDRPASSQTRLIRRKTVNSGGFFSGLTLIKPSSTSSSSRCFSFRVRFHHRFSLHREVSVPPSTSVGAVFYLPPCVELGRSPRTEARCSAFMKMTCVNRYTVSWKRDSVYVHARVRQGNRVVSVHALSRYLTAHGGVIFERER